MRLGRPRLFPWTAPTWPETLDKAIEPNRVGLSYDTAWSRLPLVRIARSAVLETLGRPLASVLASPAISGLDRLETLTNGAIFAANHASHVDTLIILSCLPQRLRHKVVVAAGADYFFDRPWKALLSAGLLGGIPVERQKVNRRSSDLAGELLGEGWSLIIFPEGGRTPDGWTQQFRGGAAYLSSKWEVPVIPVHLFGTRVILPKGASKIRRHNTTITFGKPMTALEGESTRQFGTRIESAVAQLADETSTNWWSARQRAGKGSTPHLSGPKASAWQRSWSLPSAQSQESSQSWPKL